MRACARGRSITSCDRAEAALRRRLGPPLAQIRAGAANARGSYLCEPWRILTEVESARATVLPQRGREPPARARSGLNRRSRRIVVDALPPRGAGRMRRSTPRRSYRNATSCHVIAVAVAAQGSARGTGNAVSQIRRRSGSGALFLQRRGRSNRHDLALMSTSALACGDRSTGDSELPRNAQKCRRWQTTTGPDNHESRNEGTHSC